MGDEEFFGSEVTHDLESFKERTDVIVANRWSDELSDVGERCTRGTCSSGTNSLPIRTLAARIWSE